MRVVAGIARGTNLSALPGEDVTRPTIHRVKEGMFSAVQFMLAGANVLDLYAGSGQLGIEALSRGAKHCVFVDANKDACNIIQSNLKAAGLFEKATVLQMQATTYFARCTTQFDLIVLDPPYRQNIVGRALPILATLIAPGGTVMAEVERGAQLVETSGVLQLKKRYRYGTIELARYEYEID